MGEGTEDGSVCASSYVGDIYVCACLALLHTDMGFSRPTVISVNLRSQKVIFCVDIY